MQKLYLEDLLNHLFLSVSIDVCVVKIVNFIHKICKALPGRIIFSYGGIKITDPPSGLHKDMMF